MVVVKSIQGQTIAEWREFARALIAADGVSLPSETVLLAKAFIALAEGVEGSDLNAEAIGECEGIRTP